MQPPLALTGVPQTMLWTLHNRACESLRPDVWLRDDEAVRIYRQIEFNFQKHFGRPDGSHAIRAVMFDEVLIPWMPSNPAGR